VLADPVLELHAGVNNGTGSGVVAAYDRDTTPQRAFAWPRPSFLRIGDCEMPKTTAVESNSSVTFSLSLCRRACHMPNRTNLRLEKGTYQDYSTHLPFSWKRNDSCRSGGPRPVLV
jgi:hypothetical protein